MSCEIGWPKKRQATLYDRATKITQRNSPDPRKPPSCWSPWVSRLGGELLKQLNDDEVKAVSKAIVRLDKVTADQTEGVLEEFCQAARRAEATAVSTTPSGCLPTPLEPKAQSASPSICPNPEDGHTGTSSRCNSADPHATEPFHRRRTSANHRAHSFASFGAHKPRRCCRIWRRPLRSDVMLRIAQLDRVSPDVVARMSQW